MSSPIEVAETIWTGPPTEAAGEHGYTRKLAALSTIESELGESSYSFSGTLRYRVSEAGDILEILEYHIRGILLDGPDFGIIEYRASEPLRVEIAEDRRFAIRCPLSWRDRHNPDASVDLILRGNLLENHAIAYLSSVITGVLELGGAGEVHMTTPACW